MGGGGFYIVLFQVLKYTTKYTTRVTSSKSHQSELYH